jgi:hypothetical protein
MFEKEETCILNVQTRNKMLINEGYFSCQKHNIPSPLYEFFGRIRVPPGGHFFTWITLFNGRIPPEVIGNYCDR